MQRVYEKRPTQEEQILGLLKKGKVTSIVLTGSPYYIQQYNARIWGLRKKGYDIRCEMKYTKDGKKYGEYTLHEEQKNESA